MKIFWFLLYLNILYFFTPLNLFSQCNFHFDNPKSLRTTTYEIHAQLDHPTKKLRAEQAMTFTNLSPEPITELRFYMYLNSFKNQESSFLKGTTQIFGQDFLNRTEAEWGWIQLDKIVRKEGTSSFDLSNNIKYIQPNDHNIRDESVLSITLDKAIAPGQKAELLLSWQSKMPKTIARMGYNKDFYLFCHWYPQLGVWEQSISGTWQWNCHQAFRNTEFYGDFGVYDVYLTIDQNFKIGASGCLIDKKTEANNKVNYHFHAEDVIDFAWAINPEFVEVKDLWNNVNIHILFPPDYIGQSKRFIDILKFSLEYFEKHLGSYPYPSITVVCPPFYALRSGLMEYPALITTGSFYGMPVSVRLSESLLVHEFAHQYFMAVIASNEKEEPWMDEGFATYFEDRILDAAFGAKRSVVDLFGFRMDNNEKSRLEYTSMEDPAEGIVARPGWEFNESNYKPLIYSKTATLFHTLQNILGEDRIDLILRKYYHEWMFKHPRGTDFMNFFRKELLQLYDSANAEKIYLLLNEGIFQKRTLDYAVKRIEQLEVDSEKPGSKKGAIEKLYVYKTKIELEQRGNWHYPVDVEITYENNEKFTFHWEGNNQDGFFEFTNSSKIVSVHIDPAQKILLDLNLNNNSLNLKVDALPIWKYMLHCIHWMQHLLQSLNFII